MTTDDRGDREAGREFAGLRAENEALLRRLHDAEEFTAAIRDNRVDAFVIDGPDGKRVFTLEGADRPYRELIERMQQGAATLDASGLILYCNQQLANLLATPPEKLVATLLVHHVAPSDRAACETLFAGCQSSPAHGELRLATKDGGSACCYLSMQRLPADSGAAIGVVVTDLREQLAHRAAVAAEELSRAILEQAVDAMIVCDARGVIVRCNQSARDICGGQPLERPFADAFRFESSAAGEIEHVLARGLAGETSRGVEFRYRRSDGRTLELLASIGPLRGPMDAVTGVVITLADVTARMAAESERSQLLASERVARADAERANRLKDEFVATLSHELRTPLNAIIGWTQILKLNPSLHGEVARAVDVIERNARVQAQLVADLMDVNRMLSGKLRLDEQICDFADIVRTALEALQPIAADKGVRLSWVAPSSPAHVHGDPARLQQVVSNLLSNAIKFTASGGDVRIAVKAVGDSVELSVVDTGQGIAREFLPFVFDRFRQADPSSTRRSGGLGLGLAIVKQLVGLHGGTVAAQSDGEGRGATFVVVLPARSAPAAERLAPVPRPGDSGVFGLPRAVLAGISVLVVDDEADGRDLVRRMLSDVGAHVTEASTAGDALRLLAKTRPSVVISDIGMPERDGYELIATIRAGSGAMARVPAIALTAFAGSDDGLRALRAGYQAHLSKPVDMTALVTAVRRLAGTTVREHAADA